MDRPQLTGRLVDVTWDVDLPMRESFPAVLDDARCWDEEAARTTVRGTADWSL